MGKESLALRIGKSSAHANELLHHHKRVYKKYWTWCEHVLNSTLIFKRITTCYGWQYRVIGQDNKEMRTIINFPSQATGAEILRVACILLVEHGIKILAPIHDAILIECDEYEAEETIAKAQKIMGDASEIVLGPGNRIKTEADIIKYPDRYSDPRGAGTWARIMEILEKVEVENIGNTYGCVETLQ
jgi:DNA polymerase I-like protein with 3'-5' exonuclease and polymerase domains